MLNRPYQMPLPSGQSLAINAHVNSGETGLSNRKWSYRWGGSREVEGENKGEQGVIYSLEKEEFTD